MRGHLFENLIVMEALKARFNKGRESNLYFYRDSNKNEIDLLTKGSDCMNGFEIKSSMTYSTDFQKVISKMDTYIKDPIGKRAIIYAGKMENTSADIQILNYKRASRLF